MDEMIDNSNNRIYHINKRAAKFLPAVQRYSFQKICNRQMIKDMQIHESIDLSTLELKEVTRRDRGIEVKIYF